MGPPLGPPRSACWPKCAYPTSVCANPNRLALPKPIGVGSQRLQYLQTWRGMEPQFPRSISGLGSPSHATKLPPGWTDGCIPNRCIVLVILLPTFTVFSLCPHPDCAVLLQLPPITMRALCLVLLGLPGECRGPKQPHTLGHRGLQNIISFPPLTSPALLVQGQYSRFEGITYPEPVQYSQYDQQAGEILHPPPLPPSFAFPNAFFHALLRSLSHPNPPPAPFPIAPSPHELCYAITQENPPSLRSVFLPFSPPQKFRITTTTTVSAALGQVGGWGCTPSLLCPHRCDPTHPRGAVSLPVPAAIPAGSCASADHGWV